MCGLLYPGGIGKPHSVAAETCEKQSSSLRNLRTAEMRSRTNSSCCLKRSARISSLLLNL
jgi:hypothetical protein